MNVVENIHFLPDVIIQMILDYLPRQKLIFLNTKYYNLYHHMLKHISKCMKAISVIW